MCLKHLTQHVNLCPKQVLDLARSWTTSLVSTQGNIPRAQGFLKISALRGGHTALFVPLTSIHTHANAPDRKHKPVQKVSHFVVFPEFKIGELWPANSHHVILCD